MDIVIDDDLVDYLIFVSGTLEKIGRSSNLMIEYEKILKLIQEGKSESDNEVHDEAPQEYSDDYGNDFEEKADESHNSRPHAPNADDHLEDDNDYNDKDHDDHLQESQPDPQKPTDEGEGLDQEIDDEEMISIAENCLIKIAEELLNKRITVRQLFREDIIDEEIEGEKIELLLPLSFLEGLKKLEIEDFSEIEIA